jgi:hypothetical protein
MFLAGILHELDIQWAYEAIMRFPFWPRRVSMVLSLAGILSWPVWVAISCRPRPT